MSKNWNCVVCKDAKYANRSLTPQLTVIYVCRELTIGRELLNIFYLILPAIIQGRYYLHFTDLVTEA